MPYNYIQKLSEEDQLAYRSRGNILVLIQGHLKKRNGQLGIQLECVSYVLTCYSESIHEIQ